MITTGGSTAPARPPQRARRRSRRAHAPRNADTTAAIRIDILKSAAKAFRRRGYHGATVEHIAAALRMKKGNLYYYFKNKEEILFACHQYSLDRPAAAARRTRAQRARAGAEAARAHRRHRPHDSRRTARHGADPGARSALARPLESGHHTPRPVRSRDSTGAGGRHRRRLVLARGRQAALVRAARSGELDSAVVQSRGIGDLR